MEILQLQAIYSVALEQRVGQLINWHWKESLQSVVLTYVHPGRVSVQRQCV